MRFERVYDFRGDKLPIRHIAVFGDDERMGEFVQYVHPKRGPSHRFRETTLAAVKRERVAPFGPGLALVLPCTFEIEDESGEVVADIEVGVSQGRPACMAIRARPGRELTGHFLRGLPFAKWVQEAARANTVRVLRTPRGSLFGAHSGAGDLGFGDEFRELNADLEATAQGRKRRRLDAEFLAAVASVYREALARREAPAKAVEDRFGPVKPESARRWIALAREDGHLGKALSKGRAGEELPNG